MPCESETRRRTNLRAENNTNALVIATRAIALISSYMRRIDQSRNRSRVLSSRAHFILPSFTLVYLRTPYSFDRTHYTYTHVIPICIYTIFRCVHRRFLRHCVAADPAISMILLRLRDYAPL